MATLGPSPCTGSSPTGLHEFWGKVVYTETVDVVNNESDIAWQFYVYVNRREYVTSFYSSGMNYVKIETGDTQSSLHIVSPWNNKEFGPISFGNGQPGDGRYESNPILLASGTLRDIRHDNDGSRSIYFKATFSIPKSTAAYLGSIIVEGSIALTNIPRSSAVTSVTNVNIGEAPTVKWTPALSTYTFRLSYSCGSWSYEYPTLIAPGSTSEQTFDQYTIPAAVANQITNSKTGTGTCKIETFSDSGGTTSLGVSTKTFTITVPSSYSPTASISVTPVGQFHNFYNITNITTFDYDCTASTAQAGATIVSYVTTATNSAGAIIYNGVSSTGSIGAVPTPGTMLVSLTVTDSRGYSNTSQASAIAITEYNKPAVTSAFVTRGTGTVVNLPNSNETLCPDFQADEGGGNVARITYSTSHTALTANSLFVTISYSKGGTNYAITGLSGGTNRVVYIKPDGGGFDPDESYTFTIMVYDTISTSANPEVMTVSLSSAWFPMDFLPDGSGAAFGKVASEEHGSGLLDSAWSIQSDGYVAAVDDGGMCKMTRESIEFSDSESSVTGKFTNLCYGVMVGSCTGDDIDASGDLFVKRDVFGINVKAVISIIPVSNTEHVHFTVLNPTPSNYTINVKRIDGGTISSSSNYLVLALPA